MVFVVSFIVDFSGVVVWIDCMYFYCFGECFVFGKCWLNGGGEGDVASRRGDEW